MLFVIIVRNRLLARDMIEIFRMRGPSSLKVLPVLAGVCAVPEVVSHIFLLFRIGMLPAFFFLWVICQKMLKPLIVRSAASFPLKITQILPLFVFLSG